MNMERLDAARFDKHVGSQFDVDDCSLAGLSLSLTKLVQHAKSENHEAFSLFFHGPKEPLLAQGIRKLRHPEIGEIDIFLVPVSKLSDGYEYEAVFNHILK
jgi:hypothetical protein